MSFLDTLEQMLVLFSVVIVGFICNKAKIMNKEVGRHLSSLVINVTAPFIILASAMGPVMPKSEDVLPVAIGGTASLLFMGALSFLLVILLKVPVEQKGIYKFMFVFGNINFIGFPVLGVLFGTESIFYASVMTIPFNLLIFTVGSLFVTSGKCDVKYNWRIFFSPCLVATYITIFLVLEQIQVPKPVAESCSLIGQITIPASLLIIGSSLADIPVSQMAGSLRLYIMCALKLVIIPTIILMIFLISPIDRKYADVLVVLCGMPVAAYGTMFCLKFGLEKEANIMAQGTFLSTFLSIVSIPILSTILSLFV